MFNYASNYWSLWYGTEELGHWHDYRCLLILWSKAKLWIEIMLEIKQSARTEPL